MKQIVLDQDTEKKAREILYDFTNDISYDSKNDCFDITDLRNHANLVFIKKVVEHSDLSNDECAKKAEESRKRFLEKPYRDFSKSKSSYELTKLLNVSVCPYCNEQYTYTTSYGVRPEFDHFLPKSKYPEFQLSLYNLVPSCHTCNSSLKGQKNFSKEPHLNPYEKDFDSIVKFAINIKDTNYLSEDDLEICFVYNDMNSPDNEFAKNNITDFKLEERYQFHKDEVVKLAKAAKYYTSYKRKEINDLLSDNDLPLTSVLFPDKDCDINKTSLGKLKRDISNFLLANV